MAGRLRVKLVKSPISHTQRTRGTVRALGLHRIGETVELPDAPHIRGMTRAVRFLVETVEIEGETADSGTGDSVETSAHERPAPRRSRKKEEEA
jgi:large subunit ribosomal protein L30